MDWQNFLDIFACAKHIDVRLEFIFTSLGVGVAKLLKVDCLLDFSGFPNIFVCLKVCVSFISMPVTIRINRYTNW